VLQLGGATAGVHAGFVVLLVVVFVWQLRRTRPGYWITPAGWTTLALVAGLTWMMPWYVAWVLPLAALSSSRHLRTAAMVATTYTVLVWMPPVTSVIRHMLPLPKNSLTLGCAHKKLGHGPTVPPGWVPGNFSASTSSPSSVRLSAVVTDVIRRRWTSRTI
jgi:hypothetical protein